MPQIIELSDTDYPGIWSLDGAGVSSGAIAGERSFFLFSIQVDDQSLAKIIRTTVTASVDTAGAESLSFYIWANNGAQWVRMGEMDATSTAAELVGQLAYLPTYINGMGVVYLLLTTQHTERSITVDWMQLEFLDLRGIVSGGGLRVQSRQIPSDGLLSGVTNEWLMGVQLKAYHPSDESIWKPDSYSDHWPLINRCHFYSPEIADDPDLLWHTAFGQRTTSPLGVLTPESPSGYNYALVRHSEAGRHNVNQIDCDEGDDVCEEARRNFYRSCRVYEPDPEIESAELVTVGGDDLVKVKFRTRFHHASSAPGSIPFDRSTWDKTALRTEASTIRTTENALREYLVNQDDGTNATADGPGNNAGNGGAVQTLPDNPYGSVYPTFYFVRLIPEPFEDGNNRQDPQDSPILHDHFTLMELYLRAMCEGYIDGQSTADYACTHGTSSYFDFTFENLCLQAFGDRWFTLLPASLRPDNPQGFGPMPNTKTYAATFNQFSAAINQLTRVRVMLPMLLEVQFNTGEATGPASPTRSNGTPYTDPFTGGTVSPGVFADATLPDATASTLGAWVSGDSATSTVSFVLDGTMAGAWVVKTSRTDARFRWRPSDPDAVLAIPDASAYVNGATWEGMLQDNATVLGHVTQSRFTLDKVLTDHDSSAGCCHVDDPPCPGFWNHGDGQYWSFPTVGDPIPDSCTNGVGLVHAPLPGASSVLPYGQTTDGIVCQPIAESSLTVTPIVTEGGLIEVPLVNAAVG